MSRLLTAATLLLLALLILSTSLRLVREFHERPVQVFYCDQSPTSCEEAHR